MQYIIVENFGKELKQMRKQEGMTQEELSKKANVALPTIACIELEKCSPNFSTVQKILMAFGKKYEIHYAIKDVDGNLTTNIPKRKKRF